MSNRSKKHLLINMILINRVYKNVKLNALAVLSLNLCQNMTNLITQHLLQHSTKWYPGAPFHGKREILKVIYKHVNVLLCSCCSCGVIIHHVEWCVSQSCTCCARIPIPLSANQNVERRLFRHVTWHYSRFQLIRNKESGDFVTWRCWQLWLGR